MQDQNKMIEVISGLVRLHWYQDGHSTGNAKNPFDINKKQNNMEEEELRQQSWELHFALDNC